MAELIMGRAVETESLQESIVRIFQLVRVNSAVISHIQNPHSELEFQIGESGFLDLATEPGQSIPGLFDAAEPFYQVLDFIYHKDRLAVNLVIFRLLEEKFDVSPADFLELLTVHLTRPDCIVFLNSGDSGVPGIVHIVAAKINKKGGF